ncbi:MAG: RDD family protein [Cyanobacteria bacterium P01_E01_bin.6]
MNYASFWERFAAALLDGIIMNILSYLAGFIVGLVIGVAGGGSDAAAALATLLGAVVGLVIGWLYSAIQESSKYQATLGKRALGIVVTDLDGGRISFMQATGRYFAKILSGLILLIGYIMAAFTERKQALHDMLASTLVVKK